MAVTSPAIKLRQAFSTLLSGITYTKSDSSTQTAQYKERYPGPRYWDPYIRYQNASISRNNTKDKIGWDALVSIEIVTSFDPGKGGFNWVDEIEQQIIDAAVDEPYTLAVGPEYTIQGILLDSSEYFEDLVNLGSKPDKGPRYVVRKVVQFEVTLNQV